MVALSEKIDVSVREKARPVLDLAGGGAIPVIRHVRAPLGAEGEFKRRPFRP
jgi:hypothetical protein